MPGFGKQPCSTDMRITDHCAWLHFGAGEETVSARTVQRLRDIGYRGEIHAVGSGSLESAIGYRLDPMGVWEEWLIGLKAVVPLLRVQTCLVLRPGYEPTRLPRALGNRMGADPVDFCWNGEWVGDEIMGILRRRGLRRRTMRRVSMDSWAIRPAAVETFADLCVEIRRFLPGDAVTDVGIVCGYAGAMLCGDLEDHRLVGIWEEE